MASTQALSAAAHDRKARLAQLKSLKRKQPDSQQDERMDDAAPVPKSPKHDETTSQDADTTSKYLSGRNYDTSSRGAKLGFEAAPSEGKDTLEKKAAALSDEIKRQADEEEKADKPLDLFKLQPKKPNWDLKRDLDRKLEVLNVRTDNAIARLVRERIASQKARVRAHSGGGSGTDGGGDSDEAAGIEGTTLVEATHVREREDEEEARRDREEEDTLLDGS